MARRPFKHHAGGVLVRLDAAEVEHLRSWFDELETLLDDPTVLGSDVARRLAPVAYPDDPLAEDEYQQLNAIFMSEERREALRTIRQVLGESGEPGRGVRAVVPADDVEAWLMSVNHLRLALGTWLGVEQNVDPAVGPDDPRFPHYAGYMQLSWLLEELLAAVDPAAAAWEGELDGWTGVLDDPLA